MNGLGKPRLLLQQNASPHDYQLKPSEVTAIMSSDLIIWGGPDLETFLQKPILNLGAEKNLNLASVSGLKLLTLRSGVNWETEHDHEHHDHHHGNFDQHYWLDTDNSIIIIKAIAAKLSNIDPNNANIYNKNVDDYIQQLQAKKIVWRQQLSQVSGCSFVVFHDAYQYFAKEFALKEMGAISLNPEIPPSAQRMQQIQNLLQKEQIQCIFSEPQFNNKIILTLTDKTNIYHGMLDPLGQDQHLGVDGYLLLIDNLVQSFIKCKAKN